jgi:hypothetical protein
LAGARLPIPNPQSPLQRNSRSGRYAAGAFIGGFPASMLGISVRGFWGTLIVAVFSATLLIVIFRAVAGRRTTH